MEEDVMAVLGYVKSVSGNTWVYGAEGCPKYSIKADVSIKVNDPAVWIYLHIVIIGDCLHRKGKARKIMYGLSAGP
jgi:hypothetical protein